MATAEKSIEKKRGIGPWFKAVRSEMKKVVWPSKKQVMNNTGVVLTFVIICGVLVWLLDLLLRFLVAFLF